MPSIDNLSAELVSKIILFADQEDQSTMGNENLCHLRLVSKRLDALACPVLFEKFTLEFPRPRLFDPLIPDYSKQQAVVEAILEGGSTVFGYTRKLTLEVEFLLVKVNAMQELVSTRIGDIISRFENLRTIGYHYGLGCLPGGPLADFATRLFRAASKLPFFEGYDPLGFYNFTSPISPFPLHELSTISNLVKLRVNCDVHKPDMVVPDIAALLPRCPNLKKFGVEAFVSSPPLCVLFSQLWKLEGLWKLEELDLYNVAVAVEDIGTHVQHLANLTFLRIRGDPSEGASTAYGEICQILSENGIWLKNVSTDFPEDPLLLAYLASYSGWVQTA